MSALRRMLRSRRRLLVAAGVASCAVAAAVAVRQWLHDEHAPVPVTQPTKSHIERALTLEAERAIREAPPGDPPLLSPEGLRALAEHWKTEPGPRPATRYKPQPIDRDALPGPRRAPTPGAATDLRQFARALPAELGDPRVRFEASVVAPASPR